MPTPLDRRAFLARSLALGCSAAASPLLTPVSFAAAPWDTRLVVILLRGGMDGIGVVQPYGAPDFAALRTGMKTGPADGAHDLDGFFALHPDLGPLMPMWAAGELAFVHAVSTPYRNKRSHFDGQDILEAGTSYVPREESDPSGWLNRMLMDMPDVRADTAYAIGQGQMKLMAGPAPVADWTPEATLSLSPQAQRLMELVSEDDPLFSASLAEALLLSGDAFQMSNAAAEEAGEAPDGEDGMMMAAPAPATRGRVGRHVKIAAFAAERLRGSARVASFSLNGWDTHHRQDRTISTALGQLSETLLTLRADLGPAVWSRTAVLAMTEFGRTVRVNGTAGTDHGTGGAMLIAGGAVRGGRVYGRFPGLAEADLFDRRDLMPTGDVRAAAAWVMRGLTGLDQAALERRIFPGLEMGDDPGLLL